MASSLPLICPWPFLDPSHKSTPKVSFANVLKNGASSSKIQPLPSSTINALQSINIPLHQLPTPSFKGDIPSIKISEETYKESLQLCSSKLHGRLILLQGQKPISSQELHSLLSSFWNTKMPWKLTPRGKGFYSLLFQSIDDQKMVWMNGPVRLSVGFFKPFQWSPDFQPSSYISTTAHVWVRFLDLPEEYWHPKLLLEIARSVGMPIRIDPITLEYKFGLYARVLVEVDFSYNIPSKVIVERDGFNLPINIAVEHAPSFCEFCGCIGHSILACKKVKSHISDPHARRNYGVRQNHNIPSKEGEPSDGFKLRPQPINVPEGGFVIPISDSVLHGRMHVETGGFVAAPVNVSDASSATKNITHASSSPLGTHVQSLKKFTPVNNFDLPENLGVTQSVSRPNCAAIFEMSVQQNCTKNLFDLGQLSSSDGGTNPSRSAEVALSCEQNVAVLEGSNVLIASVPAASRAGLMEIMAPHDLTIQLPSNIIAGNDNCGALPRDGLVTSLESLSLAQKELQDTMLEREKAASSLSPFIMAGSTSFNDDGQAGSHALLISSASGIRMAPNGQQSHKALTLVEKNNNVLVGPPPVCADGTSRAQEGCLSGSRDIQTVDPLMAGDAPRTPMALIATNKAINAAETAFITVGPMMDGNVPRVNHDDSNCQARDASIVPYESLSQVAVPLFAQEAATAGPTAQLLLGSNASSTPKAQLHGQGQVEDPVGPSSFAAQFHMGSSALVCNLNQQVTPSSSYGFTSKVKSTVLSESSPVLSEPLSTSPTPMVDNLKNFSVHDLDMNFLQDCAIKYQNEFSSSFSLTKSQRRYINKKAKHDLLGNDSPLVLAEEAIANVMEETQFYIDEGLANIVNEAKDLYGAEIKSMTFLGKSLIHRDAKIEHIKRAYGVH